METKSAVRFQVQPAKQLAVRYHSIPASQLPTKEDVVNGKYILEFALLRCFLSEISAFRDATSQPGNEIGVEDWDCLT